MASNTAYRPVGIEEDMRHISPNRRRYNDYNYDRGRTFDNYSNNGRPYSFHSPPPANDNQDQSDEVDNFLKSSKKPGRGMISVCCFSLIILGICVAFLLGVCLGFYVRESQQDDVDLEKLCGPPEKPRVDYDVLGGYHETLMYYIRGEEIRKFVDEFGTDDPVTGSDLEKRLERAVLKEFHSHKMDSVHVEEHEILVTYPDPDRPNRLEVLHAINDTLIHSFDFVRSPASPPSKTSLTGNTTRSSQPDPGGGGGGVGGKVERSKSEGSSRVKRDKSGRKSDGYTEKWWRHPHVSFSPPGITKAPLIYGHYGLESDFKLLELFGVSVSGRTVLIRMGRTSVADKVMEAERRGAVSVLLYWDVDDHRFEKGLSIDPDTVPYASAATYVEDQPFLWKPSIPCQTISTHQALTLIALINQDWIPSPASTTDGDDDDYDNSEDDDIKQSGDQPSIQRFYSSKGKLKDSFVVALTVCNKNRRQKIRNIVATIQGTEEKDHYTLVGAPRSSLPFSPSQDVVVSTSIIAQLVKSIQYLHNLHLWRPSRGVKVVSWGGSEFSNAGALMYIKNRQHILGSRAVAYIDASHLVSGNATIAVQAGGSLQQLLKEVAFDITDPRNEEQTIQSRWQQQSKEGNSRSMYSQLTGFGSDNTLSPFLHMVGIPTITVQFQGKSTHIQPDTLPWLHSYSYAHHYKFHIAATRILVMGLMSLVDNSVLPISIEGLAREFELTVWQTSSIIEECTLDQAGLDRVLALGERFQKTAKAFEELAQDYVKRNDTMGISTVNNIKSQVERVFVIRHHGTAHHILYPTNRDGSLQHATHLCQLSAVSSTDVLALMKEYESVLERIVKELELMLKIGA